MKAASIVLLYVFSFLLCGCSSEVDKCVADWEKANPGPDNSGDYCQQNLRDISGKCRREYSQTKAQARAEMRMLCMQAAKEK